MKHWTVDQNGEAWQNLRIGLPTASEFKKIVKPEMGVERYCPECGTIFNSARKWCVVCDGAELQSRKVVKPSAQQDDYLFRLVAESLLGISIQTEPTSDMERGHEREPMARQEYEFSRNCDVAPGGFCVTDDGLIGCSPDGFVGDDGLLEIKSPKPEVHIRHIVMKDLASDHFPQVQGQLLVTGRAWCDLVSYCPEFFKEPLLIVRVPRDEDYISGLNGILVDFVTRLHRVRAELIAKYGQFRPADPLNGMGVTLEDAEAIIAARKESV